VLAEADTAVVLVDEIGHLAVRDAALDLIPAAEHIPPPGTVHVHLGRTASGAARVLAIARGMRAATTTTCAASWPA
jgi:hypothetical protein